ncbi:YwiC-like family protein [Corynebacterium kutscheri]|uniref:YwiC-like protein n=1 Tax=Corynebacterium kutscheri TaxID=35755 RepID=A0A0F6TDV6_9CORY|nr:YwiC-like family protein [Corynebacterium kutscheri]AKE41991.1 YwiC-like protein [Corynebacterium kutscheri]VEH06208.1 Uncharacterised protein [Corynebacterium kutscheri]VEH10332.1 Uncharacterised protein [Corynebacterium kutscheri]
MSEAVSSSKQRLDSSAANRSPRPSTRAGAKKVRKRRLPGWLPNQHGAWFMLFVPSLIGLLIAPSWAAVLLLLTWWFGYFTYFAITIWVKGRLRSKHLPPVFTYGVITALVGIATLVVRWQLLAWLPIFAPIISIAIYETIQRRERSILSGWSTVLAASLMLPTAVSAATTGTPTVVSGDIWLLAIWFATYFGGSIYYVKTLIRDFGKPARFYQSLLVHAVVFIGAGVLTIMRPGTWPVTVVSACLLIRSYVMPRYAVKRGKRIAPKYIGMIDTIISLFVVLAGLIAFGG